MIIVRKIIGKPDVEVRRSIAQTIVEEQCGCRIIRDHSGAPSLENSAMCISISHTDNYIAVAFDDKQVGVDIELADRRVEHLASRFASSDELKVCASVFEPNPALLVWCAKEAIYKTLHRQGVDFLHHMSIRAATANSLAAVGDGREIEMRWSVCDNLLTVCTI